MERTLTCHGQHYVIQDEICVVTFSRSICPKTLRSIRFPLILTVLHDITNYVAGFISHMLTTLMDGPMRNLAFQMLNLLICNAPTSIVLDGCLKRCAARNMVFDLSNLKNKFSSVRLLGIKNPFGECLAFPLCRHEYFSGRGRADPKMPSTKVAAWTSTSEDGSFKQGSSRKCIGLMLIAVTIGGKTMICEGVCFVQDECLIYYIYIYNMIYNNI